MLNELLVSHKNEGFYNIFTEENNKTKLVKVLVKDVNLPFGIEEYKNKYVINFEINDNDSCKKFEQIVNKLEKNIINLIENKVDVKSVLYKKENYPTKCRAYIKKNRNKFITIFKLNDKEMSLFEIEKNNIYDLELEISGIWKYKNLSGLYINISQIIK